MAILEVEHLTKSYGSHVVLKDFDLAVDRHEVVCLIGASGSGKSTLLRCINTLEVIDSGRVRLDGDIISGRGVDVNRIRQRIGIVFQSYNLFRNMCVLDNVTLAPIRVARKNKREARFEALELLARVGLEDKANAFPDHLSGGQQQRVAIVRALAMQPELLLLDEVTSALDPELVAEVLDIIRDLASEGMTMILATHEMSFAREVASRVCFLDEGVLLEQGTPDVMFSNPSEPRTKSFLRSVLAAGPAANTSGREGLR